MALGFGPISSGPISEVKDAQATQVSVITKRFASKTFATRATDSPANASIEKRLGAGLRLSRRLSTIEGGQFGSLIQTDYGEVQLRNEDGALDDLPTRYATDGRAIRLKIGSTEFNEFGREDVQPYANFATVYTTVAGWFEGDRSRIILRLLGLESRLRDRLQQQVYLGIGGKDGTSDMAGRTKPTVFGNATNILAQLVDPTILTYQLHARAMEAVLNVYDSGVVVPFSGSDFASYTALAASTVPVGQYSSCLAEGFIMLGVEPLGAVTADVRGDKDPLTGNYVATAGSVVRMILRSYAGIDSSLFDHPSFAGFATIQPAGVNLFLPTGDQSTVEEVVRKITLGVGAFVGQDRSGLFRFQRLDLPVEGGTIHWSFTERDITDIRPMPLPYLVPWRSWAVGYDYNWTEQSDADLAGSVSQARRQWLQLQYRLAHSSNASITSTHLTSSAAPVRQSYMDDAVAAEAEAERLLAFYGLGRMMFSLTVKNVLFSVEIGQTVRVQHSRWNLSGGKNFIVVGIEDDADKVRTDLMVFG